MSVTLAKATNEPGTSTPDHLFITIEQEPDGHVTNVILSDYAPDPAEQWMDELRSTVWTTPAASWETDPTHASKVLDLGISPTYATNDGQSWADGERLSTSFRYDHTTERRTLRTVEAALIRAGFTGAHTGVIACQSYGITLDTAWEAYAYRTHDGWLFCVEDITEHDGRHVLPDPIAPYNASPRRVADAILLQLADRGEIEPTDLRPFARLRLRIGLLRITPHWANFKHRARKRLARRRNRITVRIPR